MMADSSIASEQPNWQLTDAQVYWQNVDFPMVEHKHMVEKFDIMTFYTVHSQLTKEV
jgi:hypothetical protein